MNSTIIPERQAINREAISSAVIADPVRAIVEAIMTPVRVLQAHAKVVTREAIGSPQPAIRNKTDIDGPGF